MSKTLLITLGLACAVITAAGCSSIDKPELSDETYNQATKDKIDVIFTNFLNDEFYEDESILTSGWFMVTPLGEIVTRSFLEEQAKHIIVFGTAAEPYLHKWVGINNSPVRYVASYALEKITGIERDITLFGDDQKERWSYIKINNPGNQGDIIPNSKK
jgi:hypothetical protein